MRKKKPPAKGVPQRESLGYEMRKKKPPAKGVPQRESLGYEMRKKKPPAGGCRGLDFIPDGGGGGLSGMHRWGNHKLRNIKIYIIAHSEWVHI